MRRLRTASRIAPLVLAASGWLAPTTADAAPPERVSYTVAPINLSDPAKRRFRVTAAAENVSDATVTFAIPAWSPGWYVLTHAHKNVTAVSATDAAGRTLPVSHPDPLTWRVRVARDGDTPVRRTVTLAYDLLPIDQDPDALAIMSPIVRSYGFFAPYLDETNGFVPGPAALLYVAGATDAPCRVTYKVPAGWEVATGNAPAPAGDAAPPHTFVAADYDTLADQPADLGQFRRFDRTVAGVPVSVVVVGAGNIDPKKWTERTFKVVEAGIAFMGGTAPFPRYVFHCRFPSGLLGGGGLEHKNGSVIMLPPTDLRAADADSMTLNAHELFHAWNVKHIRPATLGPFDYARPVRVPDLWWLEGVTDYVAPRLVVDAGLAKPEFWRQYAAAQITDLQNNPARRQVTLETASLKAWEGQSEGFGGLSYYNKGFVVGLLLDIELRRRTENRVGVRELLRALAERATKTGRGYPEGEVERLASEMAGGADLKPFFDRALRSTDELPLAETLAHAGFLLSDEADRPTLGLTIGPSPDGGLRIEAVEPGSAAETAGLRPGDRIVSVDGRLTRNLASLPGPLRRVGETRSFSVRRGRTTRSFTVTATARGGEHQYTLVPAPDATPLQTAIRAALSGGA